MAYFHKCTICGANLDPGEKCDCEKESKRTEEIYSKNLNEKSTGQLVLNLGR